MARRKKCVIVRGRGQSVNLEPQKLEDPLLTLTTVGRRPDRFQ